MWTPQPERAQMGDIWSLALHATWDGSSTAQAALDKAAADIDKVIEKAGVVPGGAFPTKAPPAPVMPTEAPAEAAIDWKQQSGKTVNVILNKHPYSESIIPQIPGFTEQTGINVTYELLGEVEYFTKLKLELSSGQGLYDVFMTGPQVEWQYYPGGWLEPLEPFLNDPTLTDLAWYQPDDLFPSLMAANRWNGYIGGGIGEGHQWAIPVMVEGDVLPYRADLFEKYNLTDPPVTLEDMMNAAITIREGEGGDTYGIVARGQRGAGASGTGYTSIMASYNDGKPPDFEIEGDKFKSIVNKPALVGATEMYVRAIKEGGPPGWTSVQWFDGKELIATGKYAMYPDCDFFAETYEDAEKSVVAGKMKYAFVPKDPDGEPASRVWTWALGMASASKVKEAAWLFIEYMTSPQAMSKATLDYSNYNPTRFSVFEDPDVVAVMGSWGQGTYLPTVVETYDKYLRILSTPHPQGDEVSTRRDDALQEIWSGSKTAQQALDDAAADIDEIMERAGVYPGPS
jgi:multiple sugar transport system substrate-binding protein